MTRETKLGLVIGGAFIFCFALILSRTDNEASVNQQIAGLWSSRLDEEDLTQQTDDGDLSQSLIAYAPPRVELQPHKRTRSPAIWHCVNGLFRRCLESSCPGEERASSASTAWKTASARGRSGR